MELTRNLARPQFFASTPLMESRAALVPKQQEDLKCRPNCRRGDSRLPKGENKRIPLASELQTREDDTAL
jgi:hypothetical protein